MPRRPRLDEPGSWHHLVNRGLAKRPLFEQRADFRYFLSRLARQVRQGKLEIHAFSLLTTHYHILARSPIGALSDGMRRVQGEYSRQFNRRRRRDGSLVRGRYFSRPIEDDRQLVAVVRYIDSNPVKAGLCTEPSAYEFGSMRHYLTMCGPRWLRRDWLEQFACKAAGSRNYDPDAYQAAFDVRSSPNLECDRALVEARLHSRASRRVHESLIESASARDRRWMTWKTKLADGALSPLPRSSPPEVISTWKQDEAQFGSWLFLDGPHARHGSTLWQIAALREFALLSLQEISVRTGEPVSRLRRYYRQHQQLLIANEEYAARSERLCGTLLLKK